MEELEELVKVKELQEYAKSLDVEVDCLIMFQAFYNQHKMENGSYKVHIRDSNMYAQKMNERYNWIYKQIADTIEAKYEMNFCDD